MGIVTSPASDWRAWAGAQGSAALEVGTAAAELEQLAAFTAAEESLSGPGYNMGALQRFPTHSWGPGACFSGGQCFWALCKQNEGHHRQRTGDATPREPRIEGRSIAHFLSLQ